MKARDVQAYLRTLNGGWFDTADTVDTFKSGDPETNVHGIAVSWMSSIHALEQALALGCNLFITHEPTYYSHYDSSQAVFDLLPMASRKKQFNDEKGLILLRCHDLWDQFPNVPVHHIPQRCMYTLIHE